MYRTGDLVRWNASGALEFLGRIDHQIKLRGLRIELGEIESVLLTHPAVKDVAVLARDDVGPATVLVAYVVVAEGCPSTADLRELLATLLPDYMIPAFFVPLESMPLTANGKQDRAALAPPERRRRA
jgi:acyl-coenzyme A synthetase/AMP-(fatty) acid ligase